MSTIFAFNFLDKIYYIQEMYYNKNHNIFIFDYPLPTLMRKFYLYLYI